MTIEVIPLEWNMMEVIIINMFKEIWYDYVSHTSEKSLEILTSLEYLEM